MMPDYFIDNEPQEFLGKIRVQFGIKCKLPKPHDLAFFAQRICRGQCRCGLIFTHGLRHFESFRQHKNQGCIDIVDAVAVSSQNVIIAHINVFDGFGRTRQAILQLLHLP
jgi:hypothetical protein